MQSWLAVRSDKVFQCLTDAPNARVPLPSSPEQLNNFWRQHRRIQEGPTFIEHGDAQLATAPRTSFGHSIGDQHTHGGLESGVAAEPFDIEKQPRRIRPNAGVTVE